MDGKGLRLALTSLRMGVTRLDRRLLTVLGVMAGAFAALRARHRRCRVNFAYVATAATTATAAISGRSSGA